MSRRSCGDTLMFAAPAFVAAGLNRLALMGQLIHDLHEGVYRWRQIMPVRLSLDVMGAESPETSAAKELIQQGSVHLTLFPTAESLAPTAESSKLIADWEPLLQLRTEVLAKLETLRAQKVIGKSLEAVVTLSAKEYSGIPALTNYAYALPELFNVSEVDFLTPAENEPNALAPVSVDRSERSKCDRCWRYTDDVGNDVNYPTVCLRCAEALDAIDFPPSAVQAES